VRFGRALGGMGAGILGLGASFTIQQAIRKRSFDKVADDETTRLAGARTRRRRARYPTEAGRMTPGGPCIIRPSAERDEKPTSSAGNAGADAPSANPPEWRTDLVIIGVNCPDHPSGSKQLGIHTRAAAADAEVPRSAILQVSRRAVLGASRDRPGAHRTGCHDTEPCRARCVVLLAGPVPHPDAGAMFMVTESDAAACAGHRRLDAPAGFPPVNATPCACQAPIGGTP
jgi:hypothetical protein